MLHRSIRQIAKPRGDDHRVGGRQPLEAGNVLAVVRRDAAGACGADTPAFPAYAAALLGSHPTGGNSYTVLTNGDQIFPSMLTAVKEAKRRISFAGF